jgi:hypothetical protein
MENDIMADCPELFKKISRPSPEIKAAWRRLIPEWAWKAMVDDTTHILREELPRKTPSIDIERRIRNRYIFIRREAFLPDIFIPDIVKEACEKIKKDSLQSK